MASPLPEVNAALPVIESAPPSPTTGQEGGEDLLAQPLCKLPDTWRRDYRLRAQHFIIEYLHDFDGERAALAAWPEGRERAPVRAFTCLRDPHIKAAIEAELDRRAKLMMLDRGSLLRKLAKLIYDDGVRPETQLKATELGMKYLGMLKEDSTQVNILVGLADRLSEAKKQLEGEEVGK